jgi:co-chaperonin GroES (HSP10)
VGLIHIPENLTEGREYLQQDGVLVAVGRDAWKAFRQVDETGKLVNGLPWAEVGDRITFAKNAGKIVKNNETGEVLVIMNDEDVVLIHGEEEVNDE